MLIGLVFIGAGTTKIFFFADFVQSVGDFGIVWDPAVRPFSVLVCGTEIVGGIGLLWNKRLATALLGMLLVSFIIALAYGKYLGLDIDCGCFGPAYKVSLLTQIVIDVIISCGLLFVDWSGRQVSRTTLTE